MVVYMIYKKCTKGLILINTNFNNPLDLKQPVFLPWFGRERSRCRKGKPGVN